MVEQTLERVGDPDLFAPPMIVGAAPQAGEVGKLAPNARLILEPIPRGSAAAVALAALATDEDAIMLILPSDHYITDPAPLYEAVRRGLPAAEAGHLITFGIEPERPETGYGYITGGDPIGNGVLEARSFVEKPAKEVAEQLIRSGKAYWNSGMFMFSAGAMRRELERHSPEIYWAAKAAMERASVEGQGTTPDRDALVDCPVTSIDYAVMEHSDRVAVVPGPIELVGRRKLGGGLRPGPQGCGRERPEWKSARPRESWLPGSVRWTRNRHDRRREPCRHRDRRPCASGLDFRSPARPGSRRIDEAALSYSTCRPIHVGSDTIRVSGTGVIPCLIECLRYSYGVPRFDCKKHRHIADRREDACCCDCEQVKSSQ